MNNTNEIPKYITDERAGLQYELVGDYYLIAGDNEPEEKPHIGKWGLLRDDYLKKEHRLHRSILIDSGELYAHLADIEAQAEELFIKLVTQLAEKEGVTEALKASDQMEWIRRMNSIRDCVDEIVMNEVIYVWLHPRRTVVWQYRASRIHPSR